MDVKVKKFRLRPEVSFQDLRSKLREGGSYIQEDVLIFDSRTCNVPNSEISIDIGFPEDLSKWNDFDYILVIDEDFGQPYTTFYDYYETGLDERTFTGKIIQEYNKFLQSRWYLEEI